MIVAAHVASGALAGVVASSRRTAVVLGVVLHALADRTPHEDTGSVRFEIVTGLAGVMALALARGPLDKATVGAAVAAAPDLEHVLRLPRPGGRKLFPTHRFEGWHRSGGVSTTVQLLASGALLGALLGTRLHPRARVLPPR
jgi:hypothetical protein